MNKIYKYLIEAEYLNPQNQSTRLKVEYKTFLEHNPLSPNYNVFLSNMANFTKLCVWNHCNQNNQNQIELEEIKFTIKSIHRLN